MVGTREGDWEEFWCISDVLFFYHQIAAELPYFAVFFIGKYRIMDNIVYSIDSASI